MQMTYYLISAFSNVTVNTNRFLFQKSVALVKKQTFANDGADDFLKHKPTNLPVLLTNNRSGD